MPDRENVIGHLQIIRIWNEVGKAYDKKEKAKTVEWIDDTLELLKEQEKKKFFVDSDGKITPLPDVVRCKDCIHRGKVEKCVLAAIAAEKNYPLFMLDNRGEWYCADGGRLVK